jgi:hypothetical protein
MIRVVQAWTNIKVNNPYEFQLINEIKLSSDQRKLEKVKWNKKAFVAIMYHGTVLLYWW